MTTGTGPGTTMVRRQLGKKLKRLREEAGKTHADVETAQIASASKMWRIETGKVAMKPGDVWELTTFYGAPSAITDALTNLAKATRSEGWLEEYAGAVPDWLGLYAGLEAGASQILTFHPELVHGLLQTPDYARAMISTDEVTDDMLERRLAFRRNRQRAVLEGSNPARMTVVLGAGALSLLVGSKDVMQAQIAHLKKVSDGERVDVRIIPWAAGAHPSMKGAFTVLDFADPDDPALVYLEVHIGARYLEQPAYVAQYRRLFDQLYKRTIPVKEYAP